MLANFVGADAAHVSSDVSMLVDIQDTQNAPSEGSDKSQMTFSLMNLTENKGNITLGANSELLVTADENRSTGYSWEVFENTCLDKLKETADGYHKGHLSVEAGAGGVRQWTFDTLPESANYVRGETCEVVFVYKRPWLAKVESPNDMKTLFVTIN